MRMLLLRRRKQVIRLLLTVTALGYLIHKLINEFILSTDQLYDKESGLKARQYSVQDANNRQALHKKIPYYHDVNPLQVHHDTEGLSDILEQMGAHWHWDWIKTRMVSSWKEFREAVPRLHAKHPDIAKRKIKKIMIVPGVLSLTNFAQPSAIKDGGPLGELVQWADLIAGLHALGHHITLISDVPAAQRILLADLHGDHQPASSEGCSLLDEDIIYTDIGGYRALSSQLTSAIKKRIRILDAFGTEAMYNDPVYAQSHHTDIDHWGMLGLNLKQFYTLYPHTPDNSFLGFAVPASHTGQNITKDNVGIILGKESKHLQGRQAVLQVIGQFVELHATMPHSAHPYLSSGTVNHGIVSSESYSAIAKKAKVFVGLGDPIESPGALNCLASGCVFLNPKKTESQQNQLRGKPTSRKITSQNGYLERHIGPPHVFTVDYDNLTEVKLAMAAIMKTQVKPLLPYEFTIAGYTQRLSAHVEHQDLCGGQSKTWPPLESLETVLASVGNDCVDACHIKGYVCEPAFFQTLNKAKHLARWNISCSSKDRIEEVYAPAKDPVSRRCAFQLRQELFSCAGSIQGIQRICPCREYSNQQIALCSECV